MTLHHILLANSIQSPWSVFVFYIFLHLNEWMNEWCIYIALYCVLLYTQSTLQSRGEGGLLNHHQCAASTWMMRWLPQDNGASALTTHTSYRWRAERVIEPIKCKRSPHRDTSDRLERRESHRAQSSCKCRSPRTTPAYRWRGEKS